MEEDYGMDREVRGEWQRVKKGVRWAGVGSSSRNAEWVEWVGGWIYR